MIYDVFYNVFMMWCHVFYLMFLMWCHVRYDVFLMFIAGEGGLTLLICFLVSREISHRETLARDKNVIKCVIPSLILHHITGYQAHISLLVLALISLGIRLHPHSIYYSKVTRITVQQLYMSDTWAAYQLYLEILPGMRRYMSHSIDFWALFQSFLLITPSS